MSMTNYDPERLRRWAATYRNVGSFGKADLILKGLDLAKNGLKDDSVALALTTCALVSEEQAEQRSAAEQMRALARVIASAEGSRGTKDE